MHTINQIIDSAIHLLAGATITRVQLIERDGQAFWNLTLEHPGSTFNITILADDEGNAPGAIEVSQYSGDSLIPAIKIIKR
jgi:hypothetical protein